MLQNNENNTSKVYIVQTKFICILGNFVSSTYPKANLITPTCSYLLCWNDYPQWQRNKTNRFLWLINNPATSFNFLSVRRSWKVCTLTKAKRHNISEKPFGYPKAISENCLGYHKELLRIWEKEFTIDFIWYPKTFLYIRN